MTHYQGHKILRYICTISGAARVYLGGATVRQIAKSANRAPSTVYRWLRVAGVKLR